MINTHTASVVAVFLLISSGLAAAAEAASPRTFDPVLDADPFAAEAMLGQTQKDGAVREYLLGIVSDSGLDSDAAVRHWRAAWSVPGASDAVKWHALQAAGGAFLRAGRYREAGDVLDRAVSEYGSLMPATVLTDAKQVRDVAMALRGQPAQSVDSFAPGNIPLSRNSLGLIAGPCDVNGEHENAAVIDTGSSISTISETAAKNLAVHVLTRETSLNSATTHSIHSKVGIADTVRIGPATLHHVPFIVVDDATLAPAGPEKRIDAIIGLSALAPLGRIGFEGTAALPRQLKIAPSKKASHPGNLRFSSFSPYVRFKANRDILTFFVDGGATRTSFEKRYAREHADKLGGLERKKVKVGGAGGIEERDQAIVPKLDVAIGDIVVSLENVPVDLNGNGTDDDYGSIGMDVLWAKGGYTIDFGAGTLALGTPD